MARWRRGPKYNGESLVASAALIPNTQEAKGRKPTDWQRQAWEHYDAVPEIWFAMNYIGNALRRVRLYPATQPDPQEPPQPLEPSGMLGLAAHAELDRLRGVDGTHGQVLHDAALQLSIPGEGYLALFADPDPDALDGAEIAGIFSTSELEKKSDGWYLKDSDLSSAGRKLEDPSVTRVWRPHPRFKAQPDSSMRPLGKLLQELTLLDHAYRSMGRSRISAGVAFVPEGVNLRTAQRPGGSTGDGQGQQLDPFVEAFVNATATPIADEDSALNVAPGVIKAPADLIEKFRFEKFGREYDADTAARYERVLKRVATGLDLPDSIILGIEDLNHWSAWLVDEDAFDSHLAPLVELICSSLTEGFLRSTDVGMAEDVFVWYDAAALIAHPNKASDVWKALDHDLISDEAARRHVGYSGDDAPSPQEISERTERRRARQPRGPGLQGPPAEDGSPIQASASPQDLGRELVSIDQALRLQLQAAAEGVVQRALSKAGANARARVTAGGHEGPLAERVRGVADRDVPSVLTRGVIRTLATDDELADDTTLPVVPLFHRLVSKAQRQVRQIVRQQGADAGLLDELEDSQVENRDRGAGILTAALKALVVSLLYGGPRPGQERGEASDFTVPAGLVREALAAAGGAHAPVAVHPVTDRPQGGVATGDDTLTALATLDVVPDAWEWVTGAPSRPFDGHQALDGVRFLDWTDPVLAVRDEDSWLGSGFYRPGDHDGCQCDFAPVFGEAEP